MRQAICHYSFHRRWENEKWDADRLCLEVKKLGIEGVDFHAGMTGNPDDAADRIRKAVAKNGLTLSGVSLSNNFNQEDPVKLRTDIDTVKTWMRVGAQLKAPVMRIFGGGLRKEQRESAELRAKCNQRVIDGLADVTKLARELGIVLALENHGGLPCTGEEQVAMIKAVNSPNLRATVDIGNYMSCGQEGIDGVRVAAKYCSYVHFKDFKKIPDSASPHGWKLEPCAVGDGVVDLAGCVKLIKDTGFKGFVALEYEGVDEEQIGVPKSVAMVKKVLG